MWREVRRQLPGESVLYFGDGKNCPYGTKTHEQIKEYTFGAVRELMDRGAKIIILGCNTATAAAIAGLRERYHGFPFVGMEPALKPAVEITQSGKVAVIATIAYLASEGYERLVKKYGGGAEVLSAPGKGFAVLVEEEKEGTPEALAAISKVIEPMISRGADTLVLGCTHYPFLAGDIRRVIGKREVTVINPAPAVARRVGQLLGEGDALAGEGNVPFFEFLSWAGPEYNDRLRATAQRALGMDI